VKKKTWKMLWFSASFWVLIASLGLFVPKVGKVLLGFFNFLVRGFESWGFNHQVSFILTIISTYLMILVLLRLYLFIENKLANKRTILFVVALFSATFVMNAQNPSDSSDSLDESVYMENALVTYFQRETSFFDSLIGALSFPESFEIKETETQIRFNTFVWEEGKNNFLWIGVFDKGNPEPLSEKEFSFNNLEKLYNDLQKKESHSEKITEDISLLIPIGDNPEIPGEYLIIIGDILDEEGKQAGAFEIGYNTRNLLLNRKNSWQGYPKSKKYKYSKVHAWDCKVIKLSNHSLNYPSQK
jgi:hypothetical protein